MSKEANPKAEFPLPHAGRSRQGLGNRLIGPPPDIGKTSGTVECHERLGGVLRYYYCKAA